MEARMRSSAFVLAGGKGTRLYPLTKERAKPGVPFGGRYRIVDFVLSNLINSGIYSIYVLIQFKSQSLLQHLRDGWEVSGLLRQHFIIPVPAQMRSPGEDWYRGTADAIHQNINLIEQADPHYVVIFGADHIYRMNIRAMLEYHVQKRARRPPSPPSRWRKNQACRVRRHRSQDDGRIVGFHEKSADAPTHAGRSRPRVCLHGQLHFLHRACCCASCTRMREPRQLARFRPRYSARPDRTRGHVRLRFPDQSHPRRPADAGTSTGATSEPSTRITTPAWICARPRRP